jgi:hypothetical protein
MEKLKKNYCKMLRNMAWKYGYTEQSWNKEVAKNGEHFRKIIKKNG